MELINDTVAIGTWPTPEIPIKPGSTIAIDSVPLPERTKKLKLLISELIKIGSKTTIKSSELNEFGFLIYVHPVLSQN